MEELEKSLIYLEEQVKRYHHTSLKVYEGEALNDILKRITATLFYLSGQKSDIHEIYTQEVNALVLEGKSVASATSLMDEKYPQIYMLRNRIKQAERVADAIRTNISWLKDEKQNS